MCQYKYTGTVQIKGPVLAGEDAKFLAWSLFILGIIVVIYCVIYLLKIVNDKKLREKTIERACDSIYFICPECDETFFGHEVKNDFRCPHCNVEVEELEGFYERHPHVRNNAK